MSCRVEIDDWDFRTFPWLLHAQATHRRDNCYINNAYNIIMYTHIYRFIWRLIRVRDEDEHYDDDDDDEDDHYDDDGDGDFDDDDDYV